MSPLAHCNTLQHTRTLCSWTFWDKGRFLAVYSPASTRLCDTANILQHTATCCNMLQHTATCCNILQHTATYCNTLQCFLGSGTALGRSFIALFMSNTATLCNKLQHPARLPSLRHSPRWNVDSALCVKYRAHWVKCRPPRWNIGLYWWNIGLYWRNVGLFGEI